MSSVPPARSIRVGADAWMCTSGIIPWRLSISDRRLGYMLAMSLRDIRRHVGQLAIVGFDGHTVTDDVRMIAREFDLGGVIFFARNVATPDQVSDLSRESQELAAEIPLWVSVDQEGGRVARLKRPFTEWPPMATLGRAGDEQLAARFAKALAAELHAVGISLDYTPVLDVHTNPKNPVIGDRSLADRAEDVARLGTAIIRALQGDGIAACGKHFPGHGDTSADSHFEMPLLDHPPDRLEAVELVPFKAAIAAGVTAIMTAHILIPSLDEEFPGHAVARHRGRAAQEEAGLPGARPQRRHGDEGDQRPLRARRGGGAGDCGRLRRVAAVPAGARAADGGARSHHLRDREGPDSAEARRGRAGAPAPREGALPRGRRGAPATGAALRAILGSDEHQAVAAEMARFV